MIHFSTLLNGKMKLEWEQNTFPRLSYTQAHLVLLAVLLCAAKWGEAWRALIVTEGECTRAKDPLKREQQPTVEEVYSGKKTASIGKYKNSGIWGSIQKQTQERFLDITCRAGEGRSEVTRVWLKWYRATENTSSEEPVKDKKKM